MTALPAATPPHIGELATLPLFYKLKEKSVLLIGEGHGAAWKKTLLEAAGAHVHHKATWTKEDFNGMSLALIDAATHEEAEVFAQAARRAKVPVNCIDRPELCDFSFGSIVNRSPLIISISTDGAAPVLGQAVRAKLEALLPHSLQKWAKYAADLRLEIKEQGWNFTTRRAFWEKFAHKALNSEEIVPVSLMQEPPKARVTLVGAGPGDPELLTLKALRILQSADVILYDDLVSDAILQLARREAKRIAVGKRGHRPSCKQSEINALLLEEAQKGQHVIRLKSGDPMIFGRAGEEIAACQAAGIEVDIISGISTAQAASAQLKRSLTHRNHAQKIQFITGHGQSGALPQTLNWPAIADSTASTVLYMPRKTLKEFAKRAFAAGLAKETPAVAMSSVSRPNAVTIHGTLENLEEKIAFLPQEDPIILLIGACFAQNLEENKQQDALKTIFS